MGILDFVFNPGSKNVKKEKDIKDFIEDLKGKNQQIAEYAIDRLIAMEDERVTDELIPALDNRDPKILNSIIYIFEVRKSTTAVEPLLKLLDKFLLRERTFGPDNRYYSKPGGHIYGDFVHSILLTLREIGDKRAIEPGIKILMECENETIREQAANMLDKLGWKPGTNLEKSYFLLAMGMKEWDNLIWEVELISEKSFKLALNSNNEAYKLKLLDIIERAEKTTAMRLFSHALKNNDSINVRIKAAEKLNEIEDTRAVGLLLEILKEKNLPSPLQVYMAKIFAIRKDRRAVKSLFEKLKAALDVEVKIAIIYALGELRDESVIDYIVTTGFLLSTDKRLRKETAYTLKKLGWLPRTKEEKDYYLLALYKWGELDYKDKKLFQYLAGEPKNKIIEIIKALSESGNKEVVEPFLQILTDEYSEFREYEEDYEIQIPVVQGLAKLGARGAVGPLIDILKNSYENPDEYISGYEFRICIIKALGKLKDGRATDILLHIMNDTDMTVQQHVLQAILEIRDKKSLPLLAKTALQSKNENFKLLAIEGMKKIGNKKAVPFIIKVLKHNNNTPVRVAAAKALGTLEDRKGTKPLIKLLGDIAPEVRIASAEALGKLEDPAAVKHLTESLKDISPEVVVTSYAALEKIGSSIDIEPLIKATECNYRLLKNRVIKILVNKPSPASIKIFVRALEDPGMKEFHPSIISYLLKVETPGTESMLIRAFVHALEDQKLEKFHSDIITSMLNIKTPQVESRLIRAFIQILKEPELEALHSDIIDYLIKIGAPAMEPLLTVFKNKYHSLKIKIIKALTSKPESWMAGLFIQALKDHKLKEFHPMVTDSLIKIEKLSAEQIIGELIYNDYNLKASSELKKVLFHLKNRDTVNLLLKTFEGANSSTQKRILYLLEDIGEPAMELIVKMLKHSYPPTRRNIIYFLGELGDKKAVAPLTGALKTHDFEDCFYINHSLLKLGENKIDFFLENLKHDDKKIRKRSAEILGTTKNVTVIDPLLEICLDEDQFVRVAARYALSNFKYNRQVTDGIIKIFKMGNRSVNSDLVGLLLDCPSPDLSAIEPLSRIIEEKSWQNETVVTILFNILKDFFLHSPLFKIKEIVKENKDIMPAIELINKYMPENKKTGFVNLVLGDLEKACKEKTDIKEKEDK